MEKEKQALEKEIEQIVRQKIHVHITSTAADGTDIRGVFSDDKHSPYAAIEGYEDAAAAIARLVEERIEQKRLEWEEEKLAKITAIGLRGEAELKDKDMTIGVLEATIETWKDIEAGHVATIAQMQKLIGRFHGTLTLYAGGLEARDPDHVPKLLRDADKALSSAPRVVWSGKGYTYWNPTLKTLSVILPFATLGLGEKKEMPETQVEVIVLDASEGGEDG